MSAMASRSLLARTFALCIAFAISFAQVAMAAYAPMAASPAMQESMAQDGCAGMDAVGKHVCIKSCQAEPQKAESPSLAALPPLADPGLRVDLPAACVDLRPAPVRSLLTRATAPPPHLRFSRILR